MSSGVYGKGPRDHNALALAARKFVRIAIRDGRSIPTSSSSSPAAVLRVRDSTASIHGQPATAAPSVFTIPGGHRVHWNAS